MTNGQSPKVSFFLGLMWCVFGASCTIVERPAAVIEYKIDGDVGRRRELPSLGFLFVESGGLGDSFYSLGDAGSLGVTLWIDSLDVGKHNGAVNQVSINFNSSRDCADSGLSISIEQNADLIRGSFESDVCDFLGHGSSHVKGRFTAERED
jgi:hypothetical protein